MILEKMVAVAGYIRKLVSKGERRLLTAFHNPQCGDKFYN